MAAGNQEVIGLVLEQAEAPAGPLHYGAGAGWRRGQPPPAKRPRGRARVHAMFERFHLPADRVDEMLQETEDIVAGGSMLHAYMGEPAAAFNGDLDLFVAEANVPRWRALLQSGYIFEPPPPCTGHAELAPDPDIKERREVNQEAEQMGYPGVSGIVQVLDFRHADGSKVQLVACLNPSGAPKNFGLSAAATWYDGRSLQTEIPHLTRRWYTFWLFNDWAQKPRWPERQRKYESEGFTILEDDGPYVDVGDEY
ncbi:hypothetical protein ABPG75_007384 [Micractinium tetrahymenae]